jgi:hypothetical protein
MGREYTAEFHNKEEKLIHQTSRNRYKLHEFWYYACIMSLDRRRGGKSMAWTLSYLRVSTLVFGIWGLGAGLWHGGGQGLPTRVRFAWTASSQGVFS